MSYISDLPIVETVSGTTPYVRRNKGNVTPSINNVVFIAWVEQTYKTFFVKIALEIKNYHRRVYEEPSKPFISVWDQVGGITTLRDK